MLYIMKKQQHRKQHLLNIAKDLFNAHGYHNMGINTIIEHSGVSKTTMYKHFRSKNELILEVLKIRHEEVLTLINGHLYESKKSNPEISDHNHIKSIFCAYDVWINSDEFTGCNFINASAEYSQIDNPICLYAARHKQTIKNLIMSLLDELPDDQAQILGEQIMILLDGAIISAQIRLNKTAIQTAELVLNSLLKQYFPQTVTQELIK